MNTFTQTALTIAINEVLGTDVSYYEDMLATIIAKGSELTKCWAYDDAPYTFEEYLVSWSKPMPVYESCTEADYEAIRKVSRRCNKLFI